MSLRIAVSIINYRTGDLTIACARSARSALEGQQGAVVIVDNASGDGSADRIEKWIADEPEGTPVKLVRSVSNTGFSGGHNQGIAAADADLYLLLNSDAVLRPDFFDALVAAAKAHPEAGFFAPRICWDDGTPQISTFRFASAASELIRGAGTGWVTKLFPGRVVAIGTDPRSEEIEWASFACIVVRREVIEAIGPMDEGYFLYFEDAEYCLRARRAGWHIVWVPEAVAVHFRGRSGPVKSLAAERKRLPSYYYASRTRFLYQAHGPAGLWSANAAWFLGRGIAHLRRLAGKPVPRANASEGRDIWINVRTPLGSRRAPGE